MAKIVLDNTNLQSSYKTATVDFVSGYTTFQDKKQIKNDDLRLLTEFTHTLLEAPILPKIGDYYCYTYDDFDDFLNVPKRIYSTLLQIEHPKISQFKIAPSDKYHQLKADYQIYFSVSAQQPALNSIPITQFDEYVSKIKEHKFKYQDKLSLDLVLTINDLAETMSGDLLYQSNSQVEHFYRQKDALDKYEVRYINQAVGFGVFAREPIKSNAVIAYYCGALVSTNIKDKSCAYTVTPQCLHVYLDARERGNIARFVNHAPRTACRYKRKLQSRISTANILTDYVCSQGHYFVALIACRDIDVGEQLLSNYGDFHDTSPELMLFEKKSNVINLNGQVINDTLAQRLRMLRAIDHPDRIRTQWFLLARPALAFLITLLFSLTYKCG